MKKRYMITYDLNDPGKNYDKVIQAIKDASDGAWCTYWKSSFLIRTDKQTADEVSSLITKHLDNNDRMIIIEIINNKQGWLSEKQWEYIDKTIFVD